MTSQFSDVQLCLYLTNAQYRIHESVNKVNFGPDNGLSPGPPFTNMV